MRGNTVIIIALCLISASFTVGIHDGAWGFGLALMMPFFLFIGITLLLLADYPLSLWIYLLPLLILRTNVMGYFVWATALPILLASESRTSQQRLTFPARQGVHLGLILFFACIGCVIAGLTNLSIEKLIGTYLIPFLTYYSIIKIPVNIEIESKLPKLYLFAFAFVGFGSVIYKLNNPFEDRVAGYLQLSVTMIGYSSAVLIPLSLHFISKSRNQLFDMFILIFLLIAMLLTNTRMAIPMAAIAFMFNFNKFRRFVVPILVISTIILLIGSKVFFYRYFVMKNTSIDTSLLARLFAWKTAFDLIQTHPFIGIGLSKFSEIYLKMSAITVIDLAHAHNTFFQKSLDLGIPGMITYFSFIFSRLYKGFRCRFDDLSSALTLGLSIYFLAGLLDSVFYMTEWTIFYWSLLACLERRTRILDIHASSYSQLNCSRAAL